MTQLFSIVVLLLLVSGCNGKQVTVSGSVKAQGKPVENASLSFEPADGVGPTAGGVVQNGRYALASQARLTPGKKRVRITATRKTGRMIAAGTPLPKGTMAEEVESMDLPPQEVELVLGKNEINFDIP